MPHRAAVVVRFSSLGDVLLAAHVPSFLRRVEPGRRVVFVTKERHADVLRGHPDVERVIALRDGAGGWRALTDSARTLGDVDLYDLHGTLRSWRLGAALGSRARVIRASKHGLRRRLMVVAKSLRPEPLPPVLRTYRALAGASPADPLRPWLREALEETERDRAAALAARTGGKPFVVFGVGARWPTKRWPARHFVALGTALERQHGLAAFYATDPGDEGGIAELASLLGERRDRVLPIPFRDLAALASGAAAIVSNDSAVLHLGPALGVPALGLFGSTVPAFGFARQGARDAVAEISLPCRPCDVHGRERCPLGHHACMERLTPEIALAALRPLLGSGAA
ncbi:MAG TPA: glycosyltransferase family 9 protein [Candidatus Eisenbacteria bacterium]|nr:glycosyltransferase family 9 protein [Candidatus Eisenbacteria bacterium]